jgi:peptide/nickel transport system permease protein
MVWYTIRRLIGAVGLLLVMSIVTFLIFYATPTDPARLTCGKNCTPTGIEANRQYLGLDKPITVQYINFIGGLFHDRKFPADKALQKARPDLILTCKAPCLGYSPLRNSEVWTYLKPKIPVTMSIVILGFVMWLVSGVLLGIVAALFRGRFLDRALVSGALLFYSFPTFFVSLLILQLVVFQFNWMQPPAYVGISSGVGNWLYNLFLPSLTLALVFAAAYIRLTRAYMLETMGEDYLRTARAKGVRERKVVFKHTLRAALTPIVTIAGLDFGILLAGAPITETVFSFQGLGYATVQAVTVFDLPVIVVIVLLAACFVILANLVVDLLYGVIDPRVRY